MGVFTQSGSSHSDPIILAQFQLRRERRWCKVCFWSDRGPCELVILWMKRIFLRNNISLVLQFKKKHRRKHNKLDQSSWWLLWRLSGFWVLLHMRTCVQCRKPTMSQCTTWEELSNLTNAGVSRFVFFLSYQIFTITINNTSGGRAQLEMHGHTTSMYPGHFSKMNSLPCSKGWVSNFRNSDL